MLTIKDNSNAAYAAQGSSEWLQARVGHATASRADDIVATSKAKGKEGQPLQRRTDYAIELVGERVTGLSVERFVTDAMTWGIEKEPEAKRAYADVTGRQGTDCGFILHPSILYCGASPDWFMRDPAENTEGLVEFKCPTSQTHVTMLLTNEIPEKWRNQMIFQLMVTGRKWCDFASFDPRMPPRQRIWIRRFRPTDQQLTWMGTEVERFLQEVDAMFDRFTQTEIVG